MRFLRSYLHYIIKYIILLISVIFFFFFYAVISPARKQQLIHTACSKCQNSQWRHFIWGRLIRHFYCEDISLLKSAITWQYNMLCLCASKRGSQAYEHKMFVVENSVYVYVGTYKWSYFLHFTNNLEKKLPIDTVHTKSVKINV